MDDDGAAGRLGPTAVFVEATVGADGTDDAVGSGLDGFGLLENEAEGVRLAVDDDPVAQVEFPGKVAAATAGLLSLRSILSSAKTIVVGIEFMIIQW